MLFPLLFLASCNPYAPLIGQSFSIVDDHAGTQRDEVAIILGGDTLRGLQLTRRKHNGVVEEYAVEASVVFPSRFQMTAITFESAAGKIRLAGSSTIAGVSAWSHGVNYNEIGTFRIQPDQVRQLAGRDDILVVVSGAIDLTPVKLGPKGVGAIRAFKERFVDADGIGNNVVRTKVSTSD